MVGLRDAMMDGNGAGISLMDLESLQNAKILRFTQSKKGEPMSRDCGKVIFVDHLYRDAVSVGDTWICRVRPATRDYDFAIPVQKIDGEFILGMKPELLEDLGKILIAEHQEEVRELVAPMIRSQLEDHIMNGEVKTEGMQDIGKDDVMEKPVRADDTFSIIDESPGDESSVISAIENVESLESLFGLDTTCDYIARVVSKDTLRSRMFDSPRYSAYISLDCKRIVLSPDPEGNIPCSDNMLRIWGLESIKELKPLDVLLVVPSKIDESMLIVLS